MNVNFKLYFSHKLFIHIKLTIFYTHDLKKKTPNIGKTSVMLKETNKIIYKKIIQMK